MKKIFAIALFMLTISMGASAFTNDWFTYPEYKDRAAWKELAGPSESEIIKTGEQYLKYQWKPVHASAYIEYAKTGNLELLAQEDKNREALDAIIAAELVEGKGRFILQIADIIWLETTRFSWSRPQYAEGQIPARSLPASGDKLISRSAVENAVSIAIAYHFFKDKIDSPCYDLNRAYINFLQLGKNIIMPKFNIEEDEIAQKYIHEAFPNCTINQIEMTKIAQKGGALHCISWNIKQTPNS